MTMHTDPNYGKERFMQQEQFWEIPKNPTMVLPPIKHDDGKLRYDLVPPEALEEIVKVLTWACDKYPARNWEKGMPWSKYFAASMRHLWAWWRGENQDPESGLSHLAHAACCVIFLLQYATLTKYKEHDDRP